MDRKKVLIVFGGSSTEHEVSRCSASSILKEIDQEQYEVDVMEISKKNICYQYALTEVFDDIVSSIKEIDNSLQKEKVDLSVKLLQQYHVVFPIIHGTGGEDGTLQGLFELAKVPYVGANVMSSAIGMDKSICKVLFANKHIPQADYLVFTVDDSIEEMVQAIESKFTYPVFVKPANLGSSVGVTKAYHQEELITGIKLCKKVDRKILIEEFIKGREVECAVLGNYEQAIASNVGEVVLKSDFYSYEAKYIAEEETIIPDDIDEKVQALIKDYAIKAFKAIDCYGLARVDFFLIDGKYPILNEINTLPGFTKISMYPKLMIHEGYSYTKLISKLIELAIERQKRYSFTIDFKEVSKNG